MKTLLALLLLSAVSFASVPPGSRWRIPSGGSITVHPWYATQGFRVRFSHQPSGSWSSSVPATPTPNGGGAVDETALAVSIGGELVRIDGGKMQRERVVDGVHSWEDMERIPPPKPDEEGEGPEGT